MNHGAPLCGAAPAITDDMNTMAVATPTASTDTVQTAGSALADGIAAGLRLLAVPADAARLAALSQTTNIVCADVVQAGNALETALLTFQELLHLLDCPARLLLIGEQQDIGSVASLRQRIAELGLADYVELPGVLTEAERVAYYRAADACLCVANTPSSAVLSITLCNVPVVGVATLALSELLGEGGLLLEQAMPEALAGTLRILLETPLLRRKVISAQLRQFERLSPGVAGAAFNRFVVDGPFDSSYSLAIVNREITRALLAEQESTAVSAPEYRDGREPNWDFLHPYPFMREAWRHAEQRLLGQVMLRNNYPPVVADMRAAINVLNSYAWEESGYPEAFVREFNRKLDLVTVVSGLVKKILRDNGVVTPQAVIGNGVDHILQVVPKHPAIELGGGFRFLHVSSCFPRKGPDVLLEAYGSAFSCDDDVTLVIKTFPNPHNTIERLLAKQRTRNPRYPKVVLINQDLPEDEIAGLYQACHAFVAPSRAEGFGLPFAEAMLFGLPVIVTGHGGHRDFCSDETAWLVDYRFARAESHLGLFDSAWVEPSAQHLAERMRQVWLLDPAERADKVEKARALVGTRYRWSDVVRRLKAAIHKLEEQPALREPPKVGWISTFNSKCGIATYSERLLCAFEPGQVVVLANRDAEPVGPEPDNLLRCWSAGHADIDDLVATIRQQAVEAVVFQYNYAFMPLPALAELIERTKALNIRFFICLHNTSDTANGTSFRQIRATLARADGILVHSIDDLNRLKDIELADNVILFPHGVYPTPEHVPRGLAQAMDLEGKRVIASYGFLLPHKGVKELIRAFAQLAERHPDYHLLLANACYPEEKSYQEREACEQLIHSLGLAGRVTMNNQFLADDDSLALLGLAELVVFPYQFTQESASGAVRMGIAAARPVAVTPLPIFSDVEEAVEMLPGTSSAELAAGLEALMTCLADPATAAPIQEKARCWREAHQWPPLSERLNNLIKATVWDT